jgi:hypothetical protein
MALSKSSSKSLDFVTNARPHHQVQVPSCSKGCAYNIAAYAFKVNSRFSFFCKRRIGNRMLLAESSNLIFAAMNGFFHQA